MLLPAYGPNGGDKGVAWTPRTCDPTNAASVPEDWPTPLIVTRAERVIESEKSAFFTIQLTVLTGRG
jgi:hypothetical protein